MTRRGFPEFHVGAGTGCNPHEHENLPLTAWTSLIKISALALLVLMAGVAHSEMVSQSFTLHPGWNAIFLEIEPQSTAPGTVFGTVTNLQSVWMWNPAGNTVEFIQDPDEMLPDEPDWLVYFPGNPVVTSLKAIHGNRAYLLKIGGSSTTTITVEGIPLVPVPRWKPNSFNLVGFHIGQGNHPSFSQFFASDPALADQDIYVLDDATDTWVKVSHPSSLMSDGQAFWIYCNGSSTFTGPVSVQPELVDGLIFGSQLTELDLEIKNASLEDKDISLTISGLSSNIYYWGSVEENGERIPRWIPFSNPLDLSIPAGSFQKLRIGAKRAGLQAQDYEANLAVTDNASTSVLVPVSITGIDYAGLWVGHATIKQVNEPANTLDSNTTFKTGSDFSFRLIVHVDNGGNARLLSEVIQMWQEGTWKPDPNDLGKLVVDQPGHFVLLANNGLIANYSGAALRDGRPVGRRISAPAFPRIKKEERSLGIMNPADGNMTTTIHLAPDDPTNPFRHLYHPDHREAAQSYEVTRNITMTFSDVDPDGRPIPGIFEMTQGSAQVGGIYEESITGLHRHLLKIKGTFLLHKVSNVSTLIE